MESSGQEAFQLFDLHRLFIGDTSWTFVFEIALRTAIMYAYTLGLARLLSQRAVVQLSVIELTLIVALGSAVGDPMFYPDVPLIHGLVVITVVVLMFRLLTFVVARYERVETLIEGTPSWMVRDGVLVMADDPILPLAQEEAFEQLRLKGVAHLGQVRAAYLEQNGGVSVFTYPEGEERPGLPIEPPWDLVMPTHYRPGSLVPGDSAMACLHCGRVVRLPAGAELPRCECGNGPWTEAFEPNPVHR